MSYPSVVTNFSTKINGQVIDASDVNNVQTDVVAIETFVGTVSSAVGTLYYDIRAAASNGGGHVQSANKGGTGQTAYTKGDILVASSQSVLSKQTVGTDGQVLIADSTQSSGIKWGAQNAAGTVQAIIPLPAAGVGGGLQTTGFTGNTTGFAAAFSIPYIMTVNKLSIYVTSVSVGGNLKFGLYNENGQSSVFSVTSSLISSNGIKSMGLPAVALTPGNYYMVTVPVSSVNVTARNIGGGFTSAPSGKESLNGSLTVSAGTLPANFSPSSDISDGGADSQIIFRLDT